jgi:hypothetical protein
VNDVRDYLPVRLIAFRKKDDEEIVNTVALGEITDRNDGLLEISFDLEGKRLYVGLKQDDLRAAVTVDVQR